MCRWFLPSPDDGAVFCRVCGFPAHQLLARTRGFVLYPLFVPRLVLGFGFAPDNRYPVGTEEIGPFIACRPVSDFPRGFFLCDAKKTSCVTVLTNFEDCACLLV